MLSSSYKPSDSARTLRDSELFVTRVSCLETFPTPLTSQTQMSLHYTRQFRNRSHGPPGQIQRRSPLPLAEHLLLRSLLLALIFLAIMTSASGQSAGSATAVHDAQTQVQEQLATAPAGASRCVTCHPAEVAGYARSAMAHSLRRPGREPDGVVTANGSTITMHSTPTGYWQRWENGGDQSDYRIDWVVGSGNHASGYLVDIGGHLFQSPVAYYKSRQSYDLAPGYENQPDPDFTRPVREECILCHSGTALYVSDTLNEYRSPIFPARAEAITCKRCHGPAREHLADPRAGNIVNPAKLEPAARDSICEQCHLFGVARVPNPGKNLSDFVPGERAEDVFTTYHDANPTGAFKVISHVEQLALSACARNSSGRLWCGTCHDPHNDPHNDPNVTPQQSVARYRAVCLTCHAAKFPVAAAHPAKDSNCLSCHMPRRDAKDGGHSAFTDHRIQRSPIPLPDAPADSGIAAWREPAPELRARNLGIAYVDAGMQRKSSSFIVQGYRTLTEVQAQFSNDSEFFKWIGEALLLAQQTSEAKIAFERSLELDPNSPLAEASAASPYVASGDADHAIAHLQRALSLDPLYLPAASTLMGLYQKEGDTAEADALEGKIKAAMDETPAANPAAPQSASAESAKTAEQVYKNIEVLKGVPAGQVIPAMQFITASLGVECTFCHVEGHFEKDDKEPKQIARDMMQMTFALNKNTFAGHRDVTCYSCHRGAPKPLITPLVGAESQPNSTAASGARSTGAGNSAAAPKLPANLPTVTQLFDNYIRALGGSTAIEKITTRVEKGTITFHGQPQNVEIFTQAPDKQSIVRHLSGTESIVTTFDGQSGWSIAPNRSPREMHDADIAAARMDADLQFPLHIQQLYPELRLEYPEKINDRDAYLLLAIREGQPPIRLYFDEQSGLLVRMVRYAETPLGRNPTQIDYADYRDVDGVQVPFSVTTSVPGNASSIQFKTVQQNAAIDPAQFSKPKPLPPASRQSEQPISHP
jgi:photosynthetic reaction center cytochrome c subunit